MKPFRTELTLPPRPFLEHGRALLTLGSCFAEHIGQRLLDFKWSGLNAPFGTLFHPLALAKLLRLAVDGVDLDPRLFVEHDGAYFHHDLHSRFFGRDPSDIQKTWRELAAAVRAVLSQSPCVLLTLGTAWVYETKEGRQAVANCHKQPAELFTKRLLRAEEISEALRDIRSCLGDDATLMLSLSPVRHIRDGLMENARSKSLLLLGIHEFLERNEGSYFPAYEIMLDDLRDYRFYESDMLHPSPDAIDYIWETFARAYLTPDSQAFIRDWQNILSTLRHRPQRSEAPSYQKHIRAMLKLLERYPQIKSLEEKRQLEARLHS